VKKSWGGCSLGQRKRLGCIDDFLKKGKTSWDPGGGGGLKKRAGWKNRHESFDLGA